MAIEVIFLWIVGPVSFAQVSEKSLDLVNPAVESLEARLNCLRLAEESS